MFQIQVQKNRMRLASQEYMTSGSKNVYVCQFEFSSEWDGLEKVAVFATGMDESGPIPDSIHNQLLGDDNRCFIPWEITKEAKTNVFIGVFGTQNETVVLPTVWMDIGTILLGVTTGLDLEPPTPELYEQILAQLKGIKDEVDNIESGSALTVVEGQTVTSGKNLAEQYPCAVVFVNSTISATGKARAPMNWALYSEPVYLEDLSYSDTENAIFMTDMRGITYAFTYAKDDPEKIFVDMVEVETSVSLEKFNALTEEVAAKVDTAEYDTFKQEINTKVENLAVDSAPDTGMLVIKDTYPITNVSTFTDMGLTISNYIDVLFVNSGVLNRRQDNALVTLSLSGDRTTLWMYTNNNQCFVVDVAEDGSLGDSRWTTSVLGLNVNNDPNHSGVEGENVLDAIKTLKTSVDNIESGAHGVPAGGATDQILAKKTNADYDTHWIDAPQGGGSAAYLVKSPVGTIVIWSGTADNIPAGWQLCDGTNGTPDLRDKFVLGAGTNHAVGDSGGSEEVTLTVEQMPAHTHLLGVSNSSGSPVSPVSDRLDMSPASYERNAITKHAGSSQPHPNMPPYYALCYIMKLTADETDGVTIDQVNSAIDTKLDAYEPREVYSIEEVRIGTWIDGKPLYRRVIPITLPTGDGYVSSPISSIPYVDWPVSMQGFVRATEGSSIPIIFYGGDGATTLAIQFTTSGGFYAFVKSQYLFGVSGYIIFEYTKTTDQAQTTAANTVLKAPSKALALNSIQSAAVTASTQEVSIDG